MQQGLPGYFARQPFFCAPWGATTLHRPAPASHAKSHLTPCGNILIKKPCAISNRSRMAFCNMVELMGVEPMSEKGSKRVSPGAGSRFDFPYSSNECQTELFGSFMGS